jgi:hypothetical protein
MNKKPQVKDQATGKVFALGANGMNGLASRIRDYAQEQNRTSGVRSVELLPKVLKPGTKFKCSACTATFVFKKGGDVDAFYNSIREHGQGHGQCEILPINLK